MTSSVTVSPLFQELSISSSSGKVTREITIANNTQAPVGVRVQLGTLRSGALSGPPQPIPSKLQDQLSFATVSPNTLQIAPEASASVRVTFSESTELDSGGNYVAAVLSFREQSSTFAQVIPAVSSVFFVTRTGTERYQLELAPLRLPTFNLGYPKTLSVGVKNTGNTHFIPSGKLSVLRGDEQLVRGVINQDSRYLFPGQEIDLNTQLTALGQSWPIERLEARLEVKTHPDATPQTQTTQLIIIQPTAIFFLVMGLICILLIRRKKIHENAQKHLSGSL